MLLKFNRLVGLLSILVSLAMHVQAAEPAPVSGTHPSLGDMTFTFSLHQAALGIGYTWGEGTLRTNGQTYHFRIEGGGIVALGYTSVTGEGRVFDINKLTDFDGTYWTLSADAVAGGGGNVAVLENQYGVRVNMRGTSNGAYLGAAINRLRFRLMDVEGIDRHELR